MLDNDDRGTGESNWESGQRKHRDGVQLRIIASGHVEQIEGYLNKNNV